MLVPDFGIRLICLEEEEVHGLVEGLGFETELVLYDSDFPVKLDAAYSSLFSDLSHRGGYFVLVLLDQSFRKAPDPAPITAQEQE